MICFLFDDSSSGCVGGGGGDGVGVCVGPRIKYPIFSERTTEFLIGPICILNIYVVANSERFVRSLHSLHLAALRPQSLLPSSLTSFCQYFTIAAGCSSASYGCT